MEVILLSLLENNIYHYHSASYVITSGSPFVVKTSLLLYGIHFDNSLNNIDTLLKFEYFFQIRII